MRNLKHPAVMMGILGMILLFIGIGLRANSYNAGNYVIIASIVFFVITWIWSIINVINRGDMKPFQKRFWLIAVVAAPVLGGMLFFALHQRSGRITT